MSTLTEEAEFDNEAYLHMDLLRFTTAGSVDDGKSTLIGRLLYDSKSIFEDQMESIEAYSEQKGEDHVNLALLTDGLRAEREQGITIDVAYRYFATPRRKFIIADTPGHVQYTRNMVTGASTSNLAIVLVDARHGVVEQTMRHAFIASLLRIPHLVLCVNKMDLMEYSEEVFNKIVSDFEDFSAKLDIPDIHFIPISALEGDNVVDRSPNMTWYEGATLLHTLENVHIGSDWNHLDARLPVEYVIRPQTDQYRDFRGYAGRVAGGVFRKGEEVVVLPSGFTSKIDGIHTFDGEIDEAYPPMSTTVTLEDDLDISRGDMIAKPNNQPNETKEFDLMICWMDKQHLVEGGKYALKHTTNDARCAVREVKYKLDINTLKRVPEDNPTIGLNDIARVSVRTSKPIFCDSYQRNRATGSVILIDESTNITVAAGMVV